MESFKVHHALEAIEREVRELHRIDGDALKSLPRRRNRAAAESLFLCSVEAG